MISATPQHIALLQTRMFWAVDLYRITLIDGTVLRYSNGIAASWAGETYQGGVLLLKRGGVRLVRGLEADSLKVTIAPTDSAVLYGLPWRAAVINGALDGARLELMRGHAANPGDALVGAILRFAGEIQAPRLAGLDIELAVKSDMSKLDAPCPRSVFQPGCDRTLFDAGCGLARAAWQINTNAAGGSTMSIIKLPADAPSISYYVGGELRFTGGANAGARRSVRKQSDLRTLHLSYPLSHPVTLGDAFAAWPGCPHTYAACVGVFNNGARYRGEDLIPQPETVL